MTHTEKVDKVLKVLNKHISDIVTANKDTTYDIQISFAEDIIKSLDDKTNYYCCFCDNQLTHLELDNNTCVKCGSSPCPIEKPAKES